MSHGLSNQNDQAVPRELAALRVRHNEEEMRLRAELSSGPDAPVRPSAPDAPAHARGRGPLFVLGDELRALARTVQTLRDDHERLGAEVNRDRRADGLFREHEAALALLTEGTLPPEDLRRSPLLVAVQSLRRLFLGREMRSARDTATTPPVRSERAYHLFRVNVIANQVGPDADIEELLRRSSGPEPHPPVSQQDRTMALLFANEVLQHRARRPMDGYLGSFPNLGQALQAAPAPLPPQEVWRADNGVLIPVLVARAEEVLGGYTWNIVDPEERLLWMNEGTRGGRVSLAGTTTGRMSSTAQNQSARPSGGVWQRRDNFQAQHENAAAAMGGTTFERYAPANVRVQDVAENHAFADPEPQAHEADQVRDEEER